MSTEQKKIKVTSEKRKTKEEILSQEYLTAYDIQEIIPKMPYMRALKFIKEMQEEMEENNYYVPSGKTKVALTWMIKKKLGLK